MKNIVFSFLLLAVVGTGHTMAQGHYNRVVEHTVNVSGISQASQITSRPVSEVNRRITYFDGLGRPMQVVDWQASPTKKDVVQPIAYDRLGREHREYLPYVTAVNDGHFKSDALLLNRGVEAFYNSPPTGVAATTRPYAEKVYEPSPLNRVTEQGHAGAVWQPGGGHTQRTVYASNNTTVFSATPISNNPGSKRVVHYKAAAQSSGQRTLSNAGTYASGQLFVTIARNENWISTDGCLNTVEEYKDKEGRLVLKRTYNKKESTLEMLSTYYVYDEFGNLSFVLPAEAGPDTGTPTQALLDRFCYQYRYDSRQRQIEKKLPGKEWEYTVYNTLDQVVATQDGLQRAGTPQKWTVTKYDALGRTVLTALWNNNGTTITRAALQTLVNGKTILWEKPIATGTGYTSNAWPENYFTVLTTEYFDNYAFPGGSTYTATGSNLYTRGLPTGRKVNVLGTAHLLLAVDYYDEEWRIGHSFAQHYLNGAPATGDHDKYTHTYDFSGQLLKTIREHKVGGSVALTVTTEQEYDHAGRRTHLWQRTGTAVSPRVLQARYRYTETGQLLEKNLEGESIAAGAIQSLDYRYNERGWLTSINNAALNNDGALNDDNNDLFGLELKYVTPTDGTIAIPDAVADYTGNISAMLWNSKGHASGNAWHNKKRAYGFRYDHLGRMLTAVHRQRVSNAYTGEAGYYSEYLAYDKLGNITSLKRRADATTYEDDLAYTYSYTSSGARLLAIHDARSTAVKASYQRPGTTNYAYDANGNLKSRINATDNTHDITAITYNHLNLPQQMSRPAGAITYTYDAGGRKLRMAVGSTTRHYIDGIQYEGGTRVSVQGEEGRAVASGTTYVYEYYLKDHLGNTRMSIRRGTGNTAVVFQEDHYYPFGLVMAGRSIVQSEQNRYLYNSKELDERTGFYDYGARLYDPVAGQWTGIDPLAEDYAGWSAYNYTLNNPVIHMDPDGRFVVTFTGEAAVRAFTSFRMQLFGMSGLDDAVDEIEDDPHQVLPEVTIIGKKKKGGWKKALGVFQTALDIVGVVPGFGEAADGLNALIYLAQGDYENAALSTAAMLPVIGTAATAAKWGKRGYKALEAARGVRNSHLAGKIHPKTGVPFDKAGFPNFSNNLYKGGINDVMIKPTGNRVADFAAANKAAGYRSTPKGYTWHHHQTTGRMQLVETGVHSQTGHTGGFSLWK